MAMGVRVREKDGKKAPTRYYSSKQEKAVANATSGQQTLNSGATPWQKGDVTTSGSESFLIECKTKTSNAESITVKKEWFTKNKEEAAFMGKPHTAVTISFGPDSPNYYIIEEYLFVELLEYLKKNSQDS